MRNNTVIFYKEISTSYNKGSWFNNSRVFIKKSNDNKTISWFGETPSQQCNFDDATYYFAAIGGYDMGGQTEWTITSSGTWTVPKTGTYYIELYGFGGAGQNGRPFASGGASCQSYDSVVLTKGRVIDVSIAPYNGTTTSFGSYTVAGGGAPSNQAPYYGAGSGNKGKNGAYSFASHTDVTIGNGVLSARYGVGQSSRDPYGTTGREGAVYLKYLSA